MLRHIVPIFATDFDTRARVLDTKIRDDWDESVKKLHKENYERLVASLAVELGSLDFIAKLNRFRKLGAAPLSIISYHNHFLHQIRNAFVQGAFYPALTGACAFGERVLNHLVLDLRDEFSSTPEYKKVGKGASIQSWQLAINALKAWKVLLPEAERELRKLYTLRQRSLHYNPKTYESVEDDALTAIVRVSKTIDWQFSAFGVRPWFIEGTKGACFIKQEFETDPFIKKFYLGVCPRVGIHYSYSADSGVWRLFDFREYDDRKVSDQEFCEAFNGRDLKRLAPSVYPPSEDVVCHKFK